MGRKTVLEKLDITQRDLEKSYRELLSMQAVADKYGISERTVKTYLAGTDKPPKGKVARWYAEHPEMQKLSPREVARRANLSQAAVNSYYYRRRKQELDELRQELREDLKAQALQATNGVNFPTKAVKRVIIHKFTWGEPVQVTMLMKGGGRVRYQAKFIPEL